MLLNKWPMQQEVAADPFLSSSKYWTSKYFHSWSSFHFLLLEFIERKTDPFIGNLRYLYFFEKGNSEISVSAIEGLIELITTDLQSDNTTSDPAADAFFASTLRYIQFQKQKGGAMGEKYEPLKVWLAGWE